MALKCCNMIEELTDRQHRLACLRTPRDELPLVGDLPTNVNPIPYFTKKLIEDRMGYRFPGPVKFQVSLSYIGDVF